MILPCSMCSKLYEISEVLLLPSCWLGGRRGTEECYSQKPAGIDGEADRTHMLVWLDTEAANRQKSMFFQGERSQFSKKIPKNKPTWTYKIWVFCRGQNKKPAVQTAGGKHSVGSSPHFQCSFLPECFFCKAPEFSVTESYWVECKLGSVRVKKKKATCFYKGIKSILLSNPVCSLLPWISCCCGCQRGKESWSVPQPNPKELNPLSWEPFTFSGCSENLETNQKSP